MTIRSCTEVTVHTPGPWRSEPYPHYGAMDGAQIRAPGSYIGVVYRQANGRLIAAAPDLLSALEELSSMYGHAWDRVDGALVMMGSSIERFENAHEKARAALAKAKP